MQARGVRDAMIRMANAILLLNYGRGRGLVRERDGGRPTLIVIPSQKRQQADMPKGKRAHTFWGICAKIFRLTIKLPGDLSPGFYILLTSVLKVPLACLGSNGQ